MYEEADAKYEEFMTQLRKEAKFLKKYGGEIDLWKLKEGPKRKAGFRAQKWFFEMLMDLNVVSSSELKAKTYSLPDKLSDKLLRFDLRKLELSLDEWKELYYKVAIKPDIDIQKLGRVEIKCIGPDDEIFKIKKIAWNHNPSMFVVVVRRCDEDLTEFQFLGWLYGFEVYSLELEKADGYSTHADFYFGKLKQLRKPKMFLKKLLQASKANPKIS